MSAPGWHAVRFRDDLDEQVGEDGEPVEWFWARELPNGRWEIRGPLGQVDWTYETRELHFVGGEVR